jgi:HEPN domain-containing protein
MTKHTRERDWLAQAEDDLRWAKATVKEGFFAQACFICQQVAEKALKALAYARGADLVKGHSVRVIARELGLNSAVEAAAKVLDQFYITGRYPDAYPEGAPFEHITSKQAREALTLAKLVIAKVKHEIK